MADIGLVLVLELVLISLRALSWVRSSGELERFRFLEAVFRGLSRSSSEEISITSSISAGFDTMGFFIAGLGRRLESPGEYGVVRLWSEWVRGIGRTFKEFATYHRPSSTPYYSTRTSRSPGVLDFHGVRRLPSCSTCYIMSPKFLPNLPE